MVQPNESAETAESSQGASAETSPPKPQALQKGYAYLFKYVLVGDSGVGKTALLQRYTRDVFVASYNLTIGIDFAIKTIELPNGDNVKLQLWDTAGQERYRTITTSYYRGANGVVIVYDINSEESFRNVKQWLREIERYCREDVVVIVLGTKSDIGGDDRKFGKEVLESQLQDEGMMDSDGDDFSVLGVFEASSKTGNGVDEAFAAITDKLVERKLNERNPLRAGGKKGKTIKLGVEEKKEKKKCC